MEKSFLKNVKISKNIKKPLFSAYYQQSLSLTFDSDEQILKLLAKKFAEIIDSLPLKNNLLENIQGRDNQDLMLPSSYPLNQNEKEIFLLSGEYKENVDDEISTHFIYKAYSDFHSFSGKTKIYNSIRHSKINLSSDCTLNNIIEDTDRFNITYQRFALEFFSARSLIPSFLLSPSVTEHFYFEADIKDAHIEIYSEDLKSKDDKAFSTRGISALSTFVD